ncbi:hypothetical protein RN001_009867 [Aquatica leii]|uniref:Peptidase M14 domain-containing protein n=1 Tax=Aquatica leii TaxID=1421715 RepID=A0AAN7P8K0_9COLE|nr:hypothetical protein RN001_009867 [Aquatica leii]
MQRWHLLWDCSIFHVYPKTQENFDFLMELSEKQYFRFLNVTCFTELPMQILVQAEYHSFVFFTLKTFNIDFVIFMRDVSRAISKTIDAKLTGQVTFERIMRLSEINSYLDILAEAYSEYVHVSCIHSTFKNGCIKIIQISVNRTANNPIILIEAGMHGREWIAPAQALYVIHQLVENPYYSYLIKDVDWHIIPVLNPDGYEYSHDVDVFWRKTRSSLDHTCNGVDPNRNFPIKWNQSAKDTHPCSDYYIGPKPLGVDETLQFANYIIQFKNQIRLYLSLHSYGNFILYPWGHTQDEIKNKQILHKIAVEVKDAISEFGGPEYSVRSFSMLNIAFGLSTDWARDVAKINLVFTIVLPASGLIGFHPNSSEVFPIVYQTFNELPMQILVQAKYHSFVFFTLKTFNIDFVIFIRDVSRAISKTIDAKLTGNVTFDRIMRLSEINSYLDILAEGYSEYVHVTCIDSNFKSGCIKIIQISVNRTANNPIILIEAGMHGREWIAPAQALYVIHQLVENPYYSYLIKDVDWHIIPVLNPDGYEYSHDVDVFWRKTHSSLGHTCNGVDPNRNFPIKWNQSAKDTHPCSDYYIGPKPLGIHETLQFANYIIQFKNQIRLYLSLHSYGNFILYPWGHTQDEVKNKQILHKIAVEVKDAISEFGGPEYSVGSFSMLNIAFGLSTDWARDVAKINLVFTIVLPASGPIGFHPNSSEVFPIVRQTFNGIKLFANYV